MFITLDGGDGCGKSTQMNALERRFRGIGRETVTCYDPGSTALGERLRDILLHGHELEIAARSEMFLFMAARAQLVDEVIRPALETGKVVLCDRFLLSTIVYQGYAGGVPLSSILDVGRIAVDGVMPDIGFVLDLPYEIGLARMRATRGTADRMEAKGEVYHRRVRDGFLAQAALEPERYHVVDASRSIEEVEQALWQHCELRSRHD